MLCRRQDWGTINLAVPDLIEAKMVDVADLLTKTGHWTSEDEDGEVLGTGSCWPLTGDLVVTNFHVASLGPKATVEFEYLGVMSVIGLVAVDKPRDLVIAKVRTGKLKLPVFNVREEFPRVGTDVYVLGSPCGLKQSVSRGIVSAIRPATDLAEFGVKGRKTDRFVQVDAAISQGCSGGPIIDSSGTVIAVSTFILARGQALNFGVPSAYACELLDLAEECKPLSQYCQTRSTTEVREIRQENSGVGSIAAAGTAQSTERDVVDYIIRLYLLVMAADGEFSENEQIMMLRVAAEWGINTTQVTQAMHNYAQDVQACSPIEMTAQAALHLRFSLEPRQRNSIVMDLIRISESDGISTSEAGIIAAIQKAWNDI
jgi:uncharacterized tellurite resistance protein B-like protein